MPLSNKIALCVVANNIKMRRSNSAASVARSLGMSERNAKALLASLVESKHLAATHRYGCATEYFLLTETGQHYLSVSFEDLPSLDGPAIVKLVVADLQAGKKKPTQDAIAAVMGVDVRTVRRWSRPEMTGNSGREKPDMSSRVQPDISSQVATEEGGHFFTAQPDNSSPVKADTHCTAKRTYKKLKDQSTSETLHSRESDPKPIADRETAKNTANSEASPLPPSVARANALLVWFFETARAAGPDVIPTHVRHDAWLKSNLDAAQELVDSYDLSLIKARGAAFIKAYAADELFARKGVMRSACSLQFFATLWAKGHPAIRNVVDPEAATYQHFREMLERRDRQDRDLSELGIQDVDFVPDTRPMEVRVQEAVNAWRESARASQAASERENPQFTAA
jgi:hypothetical protein